MSIKKNKRFYGEPKIICRENVRFGPQPPCALKEKNYTFYSKFLRFRSFYALFFGRNNLSDKCFFMTSLRDVLTTAVFGKVYRTIFKSNRRRLVFKTGVILYIQNDTFSKIFKVYIYI